MKLKNILKLAFVSTFAITSFTACGGGGSDGSFSDSETKIDITIACKTTPSATEIDSYITLNSGDTIVKTTPSTTISTYHDTNDVKKVCLVSGSAYILRS